MIKNLSSFISQSNFHRSIEGVHVTSSHVVATDSFKLIEIAHDKDAPAPDKSFTVKLPKGIRTYETIAPDGTITLKGANYKGEVLTDDFPKYETIIPTGKPKATITLNAEHLEAICIAFKQNNTFSRMEISIYEPNRPVVITNKDQSIRALLMPMVS